MLNSLSFFLFFFNYRRKVFLEITYSRNTKNRYPYYIILTEQQYWIRNYKINGENDKWKRIFRSQLLNVPTSSELGILPQKAEPWSLSVTRSHHSIDCCHNYPQFCIADKKFFLALCKKLLTSWFIILASWSLYYLLTAVQAR